MKLFSCESCQQTVFFESVSCTKCGHNLGFIADRLRVCALEPATETDGWRVVGESSGAVYRFCQNQVAHGVCNWLISSSDDGPFCRACRLNHIIPNLGTSQAKTAWHRVEEAKRRVLYTLFALRPPGRVQGRQSRRSGVRVPRGVARSRRGARPYRAQRRGHHDQHRRGGRLLPRKDAGADGRALPDAPGPLPP